MAETKFNVVMSNTVLPGHDLATAKNKFEQRFKLDSIRVDAIFRQDRSIIKRNVDEATGNKFVSNLNKIGIEAFLEPIAGQTLELVEDIAPTADTEAEAPSTEVVNSPAEQEEVNQNEDEATVYNFTLSGKEGEFFRIWIVNVLLTIVTLGIYSAWAKVRNNQYLYGHTEVAGSSFAYLATPMMILKGRLIAIAAFAVYSLIQQFSPVVGLILVIPLLIAIPWIITRALSFNMRMTGWRNLRFGFDGTIGGAVKAFILWPIVGGLTFGLLVPYALYKQTEYIFSNLRLGTSPVNFEHCAKPFVLTYFIAAGIIFACAVVGAIFGFVAAFVPMLFVFLGYFFAFIYIKVRISNLKLNQSSLEDGQISFDSSMEEKSFAKVFFVNSLLIVLTLGLYTPCAKVALTRYRMEHLTGIASIDLDGFVAAEEEKTNSLGEELGEAFDIDIAI